MNSEGRSVEKIQSEEHEKRLKTKMNYSIIGNLPDNIKKPERKWGRNNNKVVWTNIVQKLAKYDETIYIFKKLSEL